MECKNIQNLLIDFIEGNIQADIKVQMEEHLMACGKCRTEHKQLVMLLNDLQQLGDEQPGEMLKTDFYTMLEEEKENISTSGKPKAKGTLIKLNQNFMKYAAGALILFTVGFFSGTRLQLINKQNNQIAALQSQVWQLQQSASLASLIQPTASQRLNAVYTISEQSTQDEKMVNILINTLRNDENTNVRMAAAQALAQYKGNDEVHTAFVEVLGNETDAAMQITLINLLTRFREEKAKKAFEKILNDNSSLPVVKQQAEQGLKVFI